MVLDLRQGIFQGVGSVVHGQPGELAMPPWAIGTLVDRIARQWSAGLPEQAQHRTVMPVVATDRPAAASGTARDPTAVRHS